MTMTIWHLQSATRSENVRAFGRVKLKQDKWSRVLKMTFARGLRKI